MEVKVQDLQQTQVFKSTMARVIADAVKKYPYSLKNTEKGKFLQLQFPAKAVEIGKIVKKNQNDTEFINVSVETKHGRISAIAYLNNIKAVEDLGYPLEVGVEGRLNISVPVNENLEPDMQNIFPTFSALPPSTGQRVMAEEEEGVKNILRQAAKNAVVAATPQNNKGAF